MKSYSSKIIPKPLPQKFKHSKMSHSKKSKEKCPKLEIKGNNPTNSRRRKKKNKEVQFFIPRSYTAKARTRTMSFYSKIKSLSTISTQLKS